MKAYSGIAFVFDLHHQARWNVCWYTDAMCIEEQTDHNYDTDHGLHVSHLLP